MISQSFREPVLIQWIVIGFEAILEKFYYLYLDIWGQDFIPRQELALNIENMGSGALSDKMLLVRIIENNKIDAYFRAG